MAKEKRSTLEPILQDSSITSLTEMNVQNHPSGSSLHSQAATSSNNLNLDQSQNKSPIFKKPTSKKLKKKKEKKSDTDLRDSETDSPVVPKAFGPFRTKRRKKQPVESNLFDSCLVTSESEASTPPPVLFKRKKPKKTVDPKLFESCLVTSESEAPTPAPVLFKRNKPKKPLDAKLFESCLVTSESEASTPAPVLFKRNKPKKPVDAKLFESCLVSSESEASTPAPVLFKRSKPKKPVDEKLFESCLVTSESETSTSAPLLFKRNKPKKPVDEKLFESCLVTSESETSTSAPVLFKRTANEQERKTRESLVAGFMEALQDSSDSDTSVSEPKVLFKRPAKKRFIDEHAFDDALEDSVQSDSNHSLSQPKYPLATSSQASKSIEGEASDNAVEDVVELVQNKQEASLNSESNIIKHVKNIHSNLEDSSEIQILQTKTKSLEGVEACDEALVESPYSTVAHSNVGSNDEALQGVELNIPSNDIGISTVVFKTHDRLSIISNREIGSKLSEANFSIQHESESNILCEPMPQDSFEECSESSSSNKENCNVSGSRSEKVIIEDKSLTKDRTPYTSRKFYREEIGNASCEIETIEAKTDEYNVVMNQTAKEMVGTKPLKSLLSTSKNKNSQKQFMDDTSLKPKRVSFFFDVEDKSSSQMNNGSISSDWSLKDCPSETSMNPEPTCSFIELCASARCSDIEASNLSSNLKKSSIRSVNSLSESVITKETMNKENTSQISTGKVALGFQEDSVPEEKSLSGQEEDGTEEANDECSREMSLTKEDEMIPQEELDTEEEGNQSEDESKLEETTVQESEDEQSLTDEEESFEEEQSLQDEEESHEEEQSLQDEEEYHEEEQSLQEEEESHQEEEEEEQSLQDKEESLQEEDTKEQSLQDNEDLLEEEDEGEQTLQDEEEEDEGEQTLQDEEEEDEEEQTLQDEEESLQEEDTEGQSLQDEEESYQEEDEEEQEHYEKKQSLQDEEESNEKENLEEQSIQDEEAHTSVGRNRTNEEFESESGLEDKFPLCEVGQTNKTKSPCVNIGPEKVSRHEITNRSHLGEFEVAKNISQKTTPSDSFSNKSTGLSLRPRSSSKPNKLQAEIPKAKFKEPKLIVPSKRKVQEIIDQIPLSELKKKKRKINTQELTKIQMEQNKIEEDLTNRIKTNNPQVGRKIKLANKLAKPVKWIRVDIYKRLIEKLTPQFGIKARIRAENIVIALGHQVKKIMGGGDIVEIITEMKDDLAMFGIVKTHLDFFNFVTSYFDGAFQCKVYPPNGMLGGVLEENDYENIL